MKYLSIVFAASIMGIMVGFFTGWTVFPNPWWSEFMLNSSAVVFTATLMCMIITAIIQEGIEMRDQRISNGELPEGLCLQFKDVASPLAIIVGAIGLMVATTQLPGADFNAYGYWICVVIASAACLIYGSVFMLCAWSEMHYKTARTAPGRAYQLVANWLPSWAMYGLIGFTLAGTIFVAAGLYLNPVVEVGLLEHWLLGPISWICAASYLAAVSGGIFCALDAYLRRRACGRQYAASMTTC